MIAAGALIVIETLTASSEIPLNSVSMSTTVSTASRVYAELLRRGLVVGEVGRGTFVSGRPMAGPAGAEPDDARIDLEFNFPILPEQPDLIAPRVGGRNLNTARARRRDGGVLLTHRTNSEFSLALER